MKKTITYGNPYDQKGNRKPLIVTENIFDEIVRECKGHYGFGGENKDHYAVDVNDYNKCLQIVNKGIEAGYNVFVHKSTPFNIVAILLLCFLSFTGQAQTKVQQDKQGNYISVSVKGQGTGTKATATGKFYTDAKGVKYPVMQSKNGKLFIIRTSAKTGKTYNQYLQNSK